MPCQLPASNAPGSERPLAHYASVAHVARVYVSEWRPASVSEAGARAQMWGAVGRKL